MFVLGFVNNLRFQLNKEQLIHPFIPFTCVFGQTIFPLSFFFLLPFAFEVRYRIFKGDSLVDTSMPQHGLLKTFRMRSEAERVMRNHIV